MGKHFFRFLIITICLLACDKNDNPVPQVAVNKVIRNIEADAQYNSILTINNAVIIKNEGFNKNGILVYRQKKEGATDDFLAFDLTCTNEVGTCAMTWNASDAWYATCPCCNSRFNILGGYMESGAAKEPLRQYKCVFSDGNLYIYN